MNDRYSAFVVTDTRVDYVDEISATDTEIISLLDGLHFQFGSLRFGAEALRPFAPQLKTRTDVHLKDLYDRLLRPLRDLMDERDLVIIPAKALNYVPFHALFDGNKYVVETREIVYSPSAGGVDESGCPASRQAGERSADGIRR